MILWYTARSKEKSRGEKRNQEEEEEGRKDTIDDKDVLLIAVHATISYHTFLKMSTRVVPIDVHVTIVCEEPYRFISIGSFYPVYLSAIFLCLGGQQFKEWLRQQ